MSDQGERGVRWTAMNNDPAGELPDDGPTGPLPQVNGAEQGSEPDAAQPVSENGHAAAGMAFPEVEVPEPEGRTEFSTPEYPEYAPVEFESTETPPASGSTASEWFGTQPADPETSETPVAPEAPEAPEAQQAPSDDWRPATQPSPAEPEPPQPPQWPSAGTPSIAPEFAAPDFQLPAQPAPAPGAEFVIPDFPAVAPETSEVPMPPPPVQPPPAQPRPVQSSPVQSSPVQSSPVQPQPPAAAEAPEDVRVAPVPADQPPAGAAWEGSLFDGPAGEMGDPNYAPVMPSGPSTPPKPGKPSSGNWRMPEWINDEEEAEKALSGKAPKSPKPPKEPKAPKAPKAPKPPRTPSADDGERSKVPMFAGVGLLVVALVAAGAVVVLKGNGDDSEPAPPEAKQGQAANSSEPTPEVKLPPNKPMPRFPGTPSRALGMIKDPHSGLAYPRLAPPWQLPTKKNKLGTSGWSGQQILLTEKIAGGPSKGQIWYGQLLTGTLHPALMPAYQGPASIKPVTALAAEGLVQQYYGFPHERLPLASQPLNVGGRKGWLIASRLRYKRPGIKATGEIVAIAVIDTGAKVPAVVFASVPGTHRRLWPDINRFFTQLKPAAPTP